MPNPFRIEVRWSPEMSDKFTDAGWEILMTRLTDVTCNLFFLHPRIVECTELLIKKRRHNETQHPDIEIVCFLPVLERESLLERWQQVLMEAVANLSVSSVSGDKYVNKTVAVRCQVDSQLPVMSRVLLSQ